MYWNVGHTANLILVVFIYALALWQAFEVVNLVGSEKPNLFSN